MSLNRLPRAGFALRRTSVAPRSLPRGLAHTQRRYMSQEEYEKLKEEGRQKKKNSPGAMSRFHVQLFDSMGARIQKEREEQYKLAVMNRSSSTGRYITTVICTTL